MIESSAAVALLSVVVIIIIVMVDINAKGFCTRISLRVLVAVVVLADLVGEAADDNAETKDAVGINE